MNFLFKKQPRHLNRRAGFTMLEVVVAMAVGGIGIMAFIGLQLKAVEISDQSRNRAAAAYIATEMAERMMSNAQDYQARRYYRGEISSYWNYTPYDYGYFYVYNYCRYSSCTEPYLSALYDIIEVKSLARQMLPNGDIGHRVCGVGNTFDCLIVAWGDANANTCDPETNTSCYLMQLKIW